MNADERGALRPLVSLAREMLADLKDDDVPTRLVRVAKSSARRLPPPLEQSLIDYLIEDASFRSDVAEAWMNRGHDDVVIDAFLEDPGSAAPMLAAASDAASTDREARDVDRLNARVEQLEGQLEKAKARVVEVRDRAKRQAREAKEAAKRARHGIESSLADARAGEAKAQEALKAASERIAALHAEIADLKGRQRRLTEREVKRKESMVEPSTQASIPAVDPLDIARWLDAVEKTLRPFREAQSAVAPERRRDVLHLPRGVAPDTGEAVEALASIGIHTLVIDGYNLASALGVDEFSGADGREAALRVAGRLHRRTGADTIVVFDAVGVEGRESYVSDLGVSVLFARDATADDAIVDIVASAASGMVVITNDRELRERSTDRGAITLWSDALVEWSKT